MQCSTTWLLSKAYNSPLLNQVVSCMLTKHEMRRKKIYILLYVICGYVLIITIIYAASHFIKWLEDLELLSTCLRRMVMNGTNYKNLKQNVWSYKPKKSLKWTFNTTRTVNFTIKVKLIKLYNFVRRPFLGYSVCIDKRSNWSELKYVLGTIGKAGS